MIIEYKHNAEGKKMQQFLEAIPIINEKLTMNICRNCET